MSAEMSCGTTVVVTQRERYGDTRRSLEALCGSTTAPFELVYPPFRLLRYDSYLGQNEARNFGFREVDTEYAVFIDNDVVVERASSRVSSPAPNDNDEEALSWIHYYRWKATWPRLWKVARLLAARSRGATR